MKHFHELYQGKAAAERSVSLTDFRVWISNSYQFFPQIEFYRIFRILFQQFSFSKLLKLEFKQEKLGTSCALGMNPQNITGQLYKCHTAPFDKGSHRFTFFSGLLPLLNFWISWCFVSLLSKTNYWEEKWSGLSGVNPEAAALIRLLNYVPDRLSQHVGVCFMYITNRNRVSPLTFTLILFVFIFLLQGSYQRYTRIPQSRIVPWTGKRNSQQMHLESQIH